MQNRIEEELLIMWALSNCSKDEATLSFCDGKVKYLVPYEFSITAIYDLQRYVKYLISANIYAVFEMVFFLFNVFRLSLHVLC